MSSSKIMRKTIFHSIRFHRTLQHFWRCENKEQKQNKKSELQDWKRSDEWRNHSDIYSHNG